MRPFSYPKTYFWTFVLQTLNPVVDEYELRAF